MRYPPGKHPFTESPGMNPVEDPDRKNLDGNPVGYHDGNPACNSTIATRTDIGYQLAEYLCMREILVGTQVKVPIEIQWEVLVGTQSGIPSERSSMEIPLNIPTAILLCSGTVATKTDID